MTSTGMKKINFYDIGDLAFEANETLEEIEDSYDDEGVRGGMISIIAQYAEARELIESFICLGYEMDLVLLEDPEYDGYDDAFIISIWDELVSCEKLKRENGYLTDESDATYLLDNCNSKIISHIESERIYEVHISGKYADDSDDDDDYDDWAEDFDDHDCMVRHHLYEKERRNPSLYFDKDESDGLHGFLVNEKVGSGTFTHSYYSPEPITRENVDCLLDRLSI